MIAATLAIGSWWYAYCYIHGVSPFDGLWTSILKKNGGLLLNLHRQYDEKGIIIFFYILSNMVNVITTWSWFGTQSAVYIGPLIHGPIYFLLVWLCINYVCTVWHGFLDPRLVARMDYGFLVAGLFWYVLIAAANGWGVLNPGYYLHAAAPAFA